MKKYFLFFVLAFFLTSCVSGGKKELTPEERIMQEKIEMAENTSRLQYKEASQYSEKLRANPDIYWGEGIAESSTDLGNTKNEARKRAIQSLAEQIEIRVKSDVEMIVKKDLKKNESGNETDVEKSFNEKLKTYTNQLLTGIKESRLFLNYPAKDTASYFVYINKKDYEEKVQKDLKNKINLVSSSIKNGDKNYLQGNYIGAIKDYVNSAQMKNAFFSNLPVYDDLDGNGLKQDLTSVVKERISSFFSNISLSLLNEKFTYTAQGNSEKNPIVYAGFKDKNGQIQPLKELPLKINQIKGQIDVKPPVTGTYGEVELDILKIDPGFKETVFEVCVDKEKLSNGSPELFLNNPRIKVLFERKKSVAVAGVFFNNGNKYLPKNILDYINSSLADKGFSVMSLDYKDIDLENLKKLNADYLLTVKINAGGGASAGNYANMFVSDCNASVSLYSLPLKNLLAKKNTGFQKGYGVSADSAGWDGFGKNSQNIKEKSDEIIGKIK